MSVAALALPFDFEQPSWLWLCLLVPLLVAASLRSLAGLDGLRRVLALSMRSLLVVLLACCLAGVRSVRRSDDVTVMFLMDRSHSVEALEASQEEFVRKSTAEVPPDDRVGLIDFARNAYLQQLPMRGGYHVPPGRLPAMASTDRTDIGAAMRLAMAMFPHDTAKRMVLLSDGNDNAGDVLAEARRAKADGIPVDVVPQWYQHRNEVYFDRMIVPAHAEPGEQLAVRMILHTEKAVSGTIALFQNGQPVPLRDEDARVRLTPGSNTFYVKLSSPTADSQVFEAVFRPDDEAMDTVAKNNTASGFTFVSGSSRALIISPSPEHDAPLLDALLSENVNVVMKTPEELGEFGLVQSMNYATIILANVPAASFTEQQQAELATYVKDMGSGLIMLGGDEGFGAGGWIGSPVEEVMPVSFEIKHKRVLPRGALVLIMHSCEIPRGNYWGKAMAKKSVDTISSQDYVGVLAYTYSPGGENWEVPLDLNTNKAAVKAKIDRMQIGDMPDFGTTMQMAYEALTGGRGRDAAQKHVIVLSDGDAQAPSAKLLADFAEAKVTISTIGIGWGAHVMESTLREIALKTGGNYYAARNPRQLPKIFSKESKVVKRPLIIDEPFQPQVRQVENDLLAGIDPAAESLPVLGGLVMTQLKPGPNVFVPVIRATDDGDDPVLAHWQYELGKTVAFTSGYWPVWGKEWTSWPKFAKFWAQIVRWSMRQESLANFDTYSKVEGDRGRIVIDALDKDASYLNQLQLDGRVAGPAGRTVPVRFLQTGPGKYEADFDAEQSGQYIANVQVYDRGTPLGTVHTGLSLPFSPEYRNLKPNEALLRQVVEITGGRWLDVAPEEAAIFEQETPPVEAKQPAWSWMLAWLLLPAFLLDVAVRRLASWLALSIAVEIVVIVVLLFGLEIRYGPWWGVLGALLLAELIGWTIRVRYIGLLFDFVTHSVTALGQAGQRSEAALEQLKTARERVRDQLGKDEPVEGGEAEPAAPPPAVSRRRFDVGDAPAGEPLEELGEALGGAKASPPPQRTSAAPPEESAEGEGATDRLLRAKRRAKKKHEDET